MSEFDSAAPTDVTLAPQPLSQGQRVVYTFTAPSKTFTDIRRDRSWWLPWLLGVVGLLIFIFAMQSKIGWTKATELGMKQSPKQAEQYAAMTPSQRGVAEKFTMGVWYAIPILTPVVAAVIALVLWGTINFLFGGKATFWEVFAVWMYAGLPLVIKWLLAAIVLFAGLDADSFNPRNPVGTNIGYYLSPEMPKWLISLGTSLDIFMIWSMILAGIGLAIVGRVKRSAGLTAIFGWWILIILISVGYAAVAG
jgi:Yip1 domain